MPDDPELRGDIVVLRPLRFDDAATLRAMRAEPGVHAWWGDMEPEFPFDEPEATRFTVWVDDQVAGMIQYGEEKEPEYRHAWIDIFLGGDFQARGVGTDAVRTLARHLVDERGHHRLTIDPSADNKAAVRAYEKAGFRPVGLMKLAERSPEGVWRDTLFMEQVFPAVAGLTSDEQSP
jgi:aminoglycoside 6'-N-acetyltransferase